MCACIRARITPITPTTSARCGRGDLSPAPASNCRLPGCKCTSRWMCVCRSAPTQAHLPKPVLGGDRRHRAEPTYNHKVRAGEGRGRAAVQGGGEGRGGEGGCWTGNPGEGGGDQEQGGRTRGGDSDATRQKIALIDKIQHKASIPGGEGRRGASTSPIKSSNQARLPPGGGIPSLGRYAARSDVVNPTRSRAKTRSQPDLDITRN